MKQTTEWIVIAGLIVYLSFMRPLPVLRDLLSSPIGKAGALAGIVYVGKFISAPIAGLLLVAYARCVSTSIEGMTTQSCTCPTGSLYDEEAKKCRTPSGEMKAPSFCPCPTGFFWDAVGGECKASSPETPTPVPIATPDNAPAVSTGPVTSSAPMTTPTPPVSNMPPAPVMMGGVQPSAQTESFSPY